MSQGNEIQRHIRDFAVSKQNVGRRINAVVKECLTTDDGLLFSGFGRLPALTLRDRARISLSGKPQVKRSRQSRLRPSGSPSLAQRNFA